MFVSNSTLLITSMFAWMSSSSQVLGIRHLEHKFLLSWLFVLLNRMSSWISFPTVEKTYENIELTSVSSLSLSPSLIITSPSVFRTVPFACLVAKHFATGWLSCPHQVHAGPLYFSWPLSMLTSPWVLFPSCPMMLNATPTLWGYWLAVVFHPFIRTNALCRVSG